jgi:5-methylcytosine-specific restriction endonuclease McrA
MVEVGLKLIQETNYSLKEFLNIDEFGNYICLNCGNILEGIKKRYCSKDCYKEFKKNFIYNRYWVKIRKDILEKFDYTCQKCFKRFPEINVPYIKRKLEIHHIIPRSEGGRDLAENFTVLCRKCHTQETTKLVKKLRFVKRIDDLQIRIDVFIQKEE